jgi:hypothetical protein
MRSSILGSENAAVKDCKICFEIYGNWALIRWYIL